jgi:hypothetical protein
VEFIKHIIAFFTDRSHPFSAKFVGATLFVITTLLLDNIFGISFYYSTKLKIEQLQAIKDLREDNNDPELIGLLDQTENEILERKNVFQVFMNLFTERSIDSENSKDPFPDTVFVMQHDTVYVETQTNTVPSSKEGLQKDDSRSQLWHTITSSYFLILVLAVMPLLPFTQKRFEWNNLVGTIVGMFFLAGLIWLNQFLFGLIPLILAKPWLNYVANILLHGLMLGLLVYGSVRSSQKSSTRKFVH